MQKAASFTGPHLHNSPVVSPIIDKHHGLDCRCLMQMLVTTVAGRCAKKAGILTERREREVMGCDDGIFKTLCTEC
jgi:hypothetical protein